MTAIFDFEKNFWNIIAIFVAIIVPLIILLIEKKIKKLNYYIAYNYPLIDINEEVKEDFEIKYKGELIKDISICEIFVENVGKEISSNDFEEPIKIVISNCNFIFSVELLDCYPEHLNINIDVDNDSKHILIQPLLLNKNDFFKFKIVYEGKYSNIEVQSRIKGLKKINKIHILKKSKLKTNFEATIVSIIATLFIYYFFKSELDFKTVIFIIAFTFGFYFFNRKIIINRFKND